MVVRRLHSRSSIEFVPYGRAYGPGFDDLRRRKPVIDKLAAEVGVRPATLLPAIIDRTAGKKEALSRAPLRFELG